MRITLVLLMLIGTRLLAQPKAADVKTFTLNNQMKIMVLEDHSIPNANMYLFWKVGSRNEYPGITGLSHFFEHMMFNGAKKYGPKMFDQTMEAKGGSNNAYTTENVTVYTDWFPSSSLETMFDLEADRIKDLNFDDKMIESERGVVLSERSTGLENSNFRLVHEMVKASAFMAHPYRWSVIGYESDIKNWSKADLQQYFKTYYAPNNCVAVIVGDVQTDNVLALAKKYFEPIPAQAPPRPVHTEEPPQNGEKRVFVQKDVTTPNVLVAYHVPQTQSDDYYALELLNTILSSGNSSRLYKELVDKKQLATEVFSYFPQSIDPNLFYIYAVSSKDTTSTELEQAIFTILDEVAEKGVTENEIQKAKNQKLMEFYQEMETINGKANNIGTYEIFFGDYKKLYEAPAQYNKVTAATIQEVAKKYFKKPNRTVGIIQKNVEQ
ncbi:pitrilysin family protein [Rhodocytophaga aerolata]|uniref:Pitrilysin family protein n=1 Tax=Rhodocytophaga aerolata TaxID=455078 RepID=A0ABT8R4T7_9BACT|nr:pitrilysin family protein [Rhodocytophaga aerolata]